ncbi:peptidase [Phenylobacterium sp. Root77]|uniref:zinc-dependent metalloprotease n=1 Tax=unclassified Phenylobacterium TaxID=2640670 RepID=UPI0006FDF58B|nr:MULTISPECIES: zinc-dependent metalloprotease [unclassified Phenylobacterium]KQW69263.1 peptidase [Phenylobacterium sp. Root1277]KQW95370.1 peptidase [Phenylobacterium sp. Root1290]KRC41161.1 peptidase [Phenylobacterium sp. Root77]
MVRSGLLAAASAAAMAACLALATPAFAAPEKTASATAGAVRQDGLLPVYVDNSRGRILLSLPAPDAQGVSGRFLYVTALKTGLGSAPVGLDRARIGDTQVLAFRRIGRKVVAEFENHRFRAAGAPDAEQAAAREAFSVSTVWAGDVIETTPDGRTLVDIGGFLTRDGIGVADALKQAGEAGYKLVPDLSLADPGAVKVFPENLEFEARQTYASDTPGPEVRNIAPDPKLITFEVRHSLVKLPEPGYEPRVFDPRTGGFSTMVLDYAAPLGEEIVQRYANRFRLEKTDPAAARSPVKKPIVFYVDRAAPEPIRSALVDGAAWWNQAFDAAGFVDAFQVKVLPEGADPLDVRYNVINWVDRATRGWSYGQAVVDPRTGEIVKGSVLLGALRVRQDMLIFEGLVGAHHNGTGGPNDPIQVSLARLRQLSAHEVGHSIGFAHNFAGSTQDRASVMDYPAPRVLLKDGRIDLSDAYGVDIGGWDKFTVDWLYGEGGESAQRKVKASVDQGQRYVTDVDARPMGVAQPWGSLWDDGPDPAAELTRMMAVRRAALGQFGLGALKPGEPVANLKRKYAPIYLLHRYQLEAASKLVGGVDFAYAVIGDGRETSHPVPAAQQRAALSALLATLAPGELDTPETLTAMLSSAQSGDPDRQYTIEVFATAGGPVFDPLVAAEVAAGLTLDNLLAPDRMARLVDQHRRDPAQLGAGEMLDQLMDTVFTPATGRLGEVSRRVQTRLVLNLANAARDPKVSPAVAAEIGARLAALPARLKGGADAADRAHRQRLIALLGDPALLADLSAPRLKPQTPPGMPIGDGDFGGR